VTSTECRPCDSATVESNAAGSTHLLQNLDPLHEALALHLQRRQPRIESFDLSAVVLLLQALPLAVPLVRAPAQ